MAVELANELIAEYAHLRDHIPGQLCPKEAEMDKSKTEERILREMYQWTDGLAIRDREIAELKENLELRSDYFVRLAEIVSLKKQLAVNLASPSPLEERASARIEERARWQAEIDEMKLKLLLQEKELEAAESTISEVRMKYKRAERVCRQQFEAMLAEDPPKRTLGIER